MWLICVLRDKKSFWFPIGKHLRGVLEESLYKDRMQRRGSVILGVFLLWFADNSIFENSCSRRQPMEIHAMEIIVFTSVCKHHVAAHVLSCCALGHLTCLSLCIWKRENLWHREGLRERIAVILSTTASARFFPPLPFCELVN